MNRILKNKKKNSKALLAVLFFGLFFTFGLPKSARADFTCQCFNSGSSAVVDPFTFSSPTANITGATQAEKDSCNQQCIGKGHTSGKLNNMSTSNAAPALLGSTADSATADKGFWGNAFYSGMSALLTGVQALVGYLFSIATTLFAVVIAPENVSGPNGILNKTAIKDVWIMVRDTLNMGFILVLLFSAFCTIFQVDKWNLKKVWLNILINALLVNFSFPIARFFIDISNVAMYYFVNHLFTSTGTVTGSTIFSSLSTTTGISQILMPGDFATQPISYQIAMIVFTFIFGMTLLIVAVLFVIRLIALAMLIMFAPIGFVGYIFPSTGKYADDWWKQLFSYSFFGPVMIFTIAIALKVAQSIGAENMKSFQANAGVNSQSGTASWIANTAFYFIPVIILWAGMGVAKSFGVAGADMVVSTGQKWGTAAGKWLAYGNPVGRGIKKGVMEKEIYGGSINKAIKWWKGPSQIEGAVAGGIKGIGTEDGMMKSAAKGYAGGINDENAKDVKEAADKKDTSNMTEVDLRNLATKGGRFEKAAALLELANRGKAEARDIDFIKNTFGDGSKVFNQLRNKVKTYDPVAAFGSGFDAVGNVTFNVDASQRMKEHLESNQFDAKKINADSLGNKQFVAMAMASGSITPKELGELAGKGAKYAKNISDSITFVAGKTDAAGNHLYSNVNDPDPEKKEINMNIHLAHLASTGTIHNSLNTPALRAEIFKKFDKDNTKGLKDTEISRHAREIVENVNSGNFKDIVTNMKSKESKKAIIAAIATFLSGPHPTAQVIALSKQIENDPYLSSLT